MRQQGFNMGLVRNWRPLLREKIVYITPDGNVYNLHTQTPKSVLKMSGWGMAQAEYGLTKGPYQHGLTVLTARLMQRQITVEIRHRGCNRTEYWSNRAGLVDSLRINRTNVNFPQPGHLRWYRADGTIRQVDVFLEHGPDFNTLGNDAWDEFSFNDVLDFKAYNPVIYDPNILTGSITDFTCTNVAALTFPFSFGGSSLTFGGTVCESTQNLVINYLGNWPEYPVITIQGPATDPRITHVETGNIIAFDGYTIATNELVTIDLSYSRKTINSSLNGNLLGYLSTDSTLGQFSIEADPTAAGGVNTYQIIIQSGSAATVVTFTYYSRFAGI